MINVNVDNQIISRVTETLLFIDKNPNNNIRKISKELEIDYNYVAKIVERCEEKGLIDTKLVSRERLVTLTEKGATITNYFKQIKELL